MSKDSLAEARLAEYRQRRKVELLRQQLYAQADPSASPKLAQALMEAEAELHRLEKTLREQQKVRGVLLDTSGEGEKGGIMLGAETTGVDAKVMQRMSHVPTGIVHLLDASRTPLVSFGVKYAGPESVRLRLTSFVEGYSARAVDTVELVAKPPKEPSVEIHQLPTFFADRLEPIREMTRATLHIVIDDLDGKTEQESTFPIWLLARTSAYNGVEDPSTGNWVDLSPYYGAWVTPNAPEVMQVLRRAADLHAARQIVGYQVDASGVEEQVRAIFEALKAEGVVYINSVLSFGATKGEYMQRVRLPRESLANRSANCIDGTVLVASVLEAASLNPGLVLVPGHAFLAWEAEEGSGKWDYLETTMIGSHDFDAAHQSGQETAQQYKTLFEQTKDPYYFTLLSLPQLRAEFGITPME